MDYSDLQKKYGGQFVARKGDDVVAGAKTHGELVRLLEQQGIKFTEVTFAYVRPKDRIYAL